MADNDNEPLAPNTGQPAPDGAAGSRGRSGSTGRSEAQQATSSTRQTIEEAKQTAGNLAGRAKEQGRHVFDEQKHTAAKQVDSVAQAFRSAASELQGDKETRAGRYVGLAAEQLQSFAEQLRHKDMESLVRDAENLGRRSPATLFAGSLVAGFLLARFLKSSGSQTQESSRMADEDSLAAYGGEPEGALYGSTDWTGSDIDSGASDLAMAGSVLPDSPSGAGPSTVVRGPESADTPSLNESKPGGNYGNR